MESPELSARLRYLNESAHRLATTSATTSRHLMIRRNALLLDSKIELSDEQRMKACGACGAIPIKGWEALLDHGIQKKKGKGRQEKEGSKQPKVMIYSCKTCSRKTRISTRTPKSARRNKASLHSTSISTAPTQQPQGGASTAPSQKTAKRKQRKKGVLEAILARNQPQTSNNGFGLDLSDFMTKS